MKDLTAALRMTAWMTLLCGGLYTLAVTGASRWAFRDSAEGSLIERGGVVVGSALIAQKFTSQRYFWERPSAVDYNPQPSGGSNLGPTSAALKQAVDQRRVALEKADPGEGEPPQDLLFASASGLDPDISPAAALYQVDRVAQARGFGPARTARLRTLVEAAVEGPQWGLLGEPRVNVLKLNLALDAMDRP